MARAKKETALTPEERLQVALVPDWEWPYKLPENWCWTRLGNYVDYVTDYVANGSFASLKANVSIFKDENYALMVKTQDFANGFTKSLTYTDKHGYDFLSKSTLHGGELILSNIGSVGKVFRVPYFDRPMTLASNSVMVKCYNSRDYDWMYYFLLSPIGFEELKSITTGTAVPKFNKTDLKTIPLPVSPLARKAAILHKAFTGELTAKWREEHGVRMDSWEKKSVGELCISLKYGTAKKSDASGNVVVLRMGNLQQGEIDWSDLAYSKDPDDIEKYKLYPGDVLFNRTNSAALVGKTAIYRGEHPAIYAGYLIKLDYDHDKIIGDYLNYALNTLDAKKYCNSVKTDGVNQSNINAKKIGAYSFNVPSIPEQEKIVSVIQKLLSKEQQAKEAAEAVLDQIDLMKKSILACAFRGELGTNDPSEESAVELLKEIIRRG